MSDFNAMAFIARSVANKTATTTLVQIISVDAAKMLVDVHPMVAQLDGLGNATPHGTIHGIPYVRLQGGKYAVIIDPEVGDIGVAVFASHDLSVVKATKAPGSPGSRRRFSMADGIYIGGLLNKEPESYVKISADGVEVKADTIKLVGDVEITGDVTLTGDMTATGDFTADGEVTADGIALSSHTHGGVDAGSGTSGPPS